MQTIDYRNIAINSIIDTQLKLKILYSYKREIDFENTDKETLRSMCLAILYSIFLKKVTSSKSNNRMIKNYFKLFLTQIEKENLINSTQNKTTLDESYRTTLAIMNLYPMTYKK